MELVNSLCDAACASPALVQFAGARNHRASNSVHQDPAKDLPTVAYTLRRALTNGRPFFLELSLPRFLLSQYRP